MNKMHIIAKIIAGILGIYLLITNILGLVGSLTFIVMGASQGGTLYFILIVSSLLLTLSFIIAVFYFLIYRSDIFAQRVVGWEEPLDVNCVFSWYPFALRLTMIIAGFLFLQRAISLSSSLANYIRYSFHSDTLEGMDRVYEYGVYFLIYLAISIYLLRGAPQFVRWQVKKTLELCKEFSEK